MLSMLDVYKEEPRRRISALFHRLTHPAVSGAVNWAGGQPYMFIRCEERGGALDWRMIHSHCLEPSRRLLLPRDVVCPEESGLRRFEPSRYIRRMLERIAMDTLVLSETPPQHRSLALYGRESEIIMLIPHLIRLVGELHIITRRPEALAPSVEAVVAQTGMPITMSGELSTHGCSMLLAPAGGARALELSGTTIVLSPDRPVTYEGCWVGGFVPSLPPVLEDIYTDTYDLCEFCGAFFELTGLGMMSAPEAALSGSTRIELQELAALL